MRLINFFFLISVFISFSFSESSCSGNKKFLKQSSGVPSHPRILMLEEEEETIKGAIATYSTWGAIHQLIMNVSDDFLNDPPVKYELDGIRLLEVSRECRRRVFYLSYAWRMTGDKKYFHRAEQELLAVSAFKDWNPSHFLDAAEMTMAVALGYDWLYELLSESTRETLRNAILAKGLLPSLEKKYNWWLEADNNWNQVCNASMAFGALALYDHDPDFATEILNRSIGSVGIAMKEYGPDGAYPEGYMYWEYGTTFSALLISALEKAFGSDFGLSQNAGFMKTAGYQLHMLGPTGQPFNYSDGDPEPLVNPAMYWFSDRLQDPSLLFGEKRILKDAIYPFTDLPVLLLWGAHLDFGSVPMPEELLWSGQGKNPVAVLRSSWDTDAIYVGLKGGSPQVGHGHMDVGSFVMDALGVRWAVDLGKQDYTAIEERGIDLWDISQQSGRWKIFRYNNLSHNTLAFNGEFQLVDGYAPIDKVSSSDSFLSATVDITSCYRNHVSRALRGVAIVDKEYVMVRDEIELSGVPAKVRWAMVTPAKVDIISSSTARLTMEGKTLWMHIIAPGEPTVTTWTTEPPNDFDEPNPGTVMVGFEVNLPARAKADLTVVLTPHGPASVDTEKLKPLRDW